MKTERRREPKPCPRCYAPMLATASGFECERHGIPPPERPIHVRREPLVSGPRTPRTPRAPRQTKPRPVSPQTQRLIDMRETIIDRNKRGEPIAAIARDLWQELGYADAHVASSKISVFLSKVGIGAAPVRAGPQPGAQPASRFTEERLSEVEAALSAGENVWAFAGKNWQAWGFSTRSSCDSLIRKWLRTSPKSPSEEEL